MWKINISKWAAYLITITKSLTDKLYKYEYQRLTDSTTMPQPDKSTVNLAKVLENDASWVYSNRVRSLMSEYIEIKKLQAKKSEVKMVNYKENMEDKARVFIKYDLNSKTYPFDLFENTFINN